MATTVPRETQGSLSNTVWTRGTERGTMVPQNLNNFKNQPFHNILNTNLLNLWNEAAPAVMVVAVMVVAVANNHGNGFLLYLLLSCLLHNVNHNWTENLTFSKFVLRANIKKVILKETVLRDFEGLILWMQWFVWRYFC